MRAVIVYESMYGNTRAIAEAIAEGLESTETAVVPVGAADRSALHDADLIVIGAPTHAFSLSRPQSRAAAADATRKQGNRLRLDSGASGIGVREWLASPLPPGLTAVFDTRVKWSRLGHASRAIEKQLGRLGTPMLVSSQSFFVTKENTLIVGELERAREWGHELARHLVGGQKASAQPNTNPATTPQ